MTEPRIHSEALDAITVKEEEARKRLGSTFVAFVQPLPTAARAELEKLQKRSKNANREEKYTLGFIVFAGAAHKRIMTANFSANIIGSPSVQAQETKSVIRELYEEVEDKLDARDAHAPRIISGLRSYLQFVLEDKDEPRAVGTETLFVDYGDISGGYVRWCSFDGTDDSEKVSTESRRIIVCGCYDEKIHTKVRRTLKKFVQTKVFPSNASLKDMVSELKRETGQKNAGFLPVTI